MDYLTILILFMAWREGMNEVKLFIGWSGETSLRVAEIVKEWLQSALHGVQPFVSADDIDKGSHRFITLLRELEDSRFGLLCLTRENLTSPWLNFEAGALSKSVGKGRVAPLLFGVDKRDVVGPLLHFQATDFDSKDLFKLYASLNNACDRPLVDVVLRRSFETWWPVLDGQISELSLNTDSEVSQKVDSIDLLNEILVLLRGQEKAMANLAAANARLQTGRVDLS